MHVYTLYQWTCTILAHNALVYTSAMHLRKHACTYIVFDLAAQRETDSILNLTTLLKMEFCVPLSVHDCSASIPFLI